MLTGSWWLRSCVRCFCVRCDSYTPYVALSPRKGYDSRPYPFSSPGCSRPVGRQLMSQALFSSSPLQVALGFIIIFRLLRNRGFLPNLLAFCMCSANAMSSSELLSSALAGAAAAFGALAGTFPLGCCLRFVGRLGTSESIASRSCAFASVSCFASTTFCGGVWQGQSCYNPAARCKVLCMGSRYFPLTQDPAPLQCSLRTRL